MHLSKIHYCISIHYPPISTSYDHLRQYNRHTHSTHSLIRFFHYQNMLSRLVLVATALQAGFATAIGNAIVSNRCAYDIWLWSVDQGHSSPPIHVPARTKYTEPLRSACNGCGSSLKISKTDQLVNGKHTQFEYSIADSNIWYDISFVDCAKGESASNCPGHDKGLAMDSPEQACGKVHCAAGSYCPTQSYYVDQPKQKLGLDEPVFGCLGKGTGMDLYMKVCSDEAPLKRSVAGRMAFDDYA